MKFNSIIIILVLLSLGIYSCSPALYTPTAKTTPDAKMLADLEAGRSLYLKNCGKCHKLHSPKQYNAAKWEHNLERMQPKAHITNEERALIFSYVTNAPGAKK